MSWLDRVNTPADLKALSLEELQLLAEELRERTVEAVSQTGGHLGAGLGVVELTVALHHVFDTPKDKLIWDVGHQSYPHKLLTGRKERIDTLRQPGGLAGFTKRQESDYDPFGAGHSSTSVSAALGMAVARDLAGETNEVIAVIGDGAMSAGMAYEAMNNAGALDSRLIVILNDNKMSIAPAVGAMSNYLARLIASRPYLTFRHMAKQVASHLPEAFERAARRAEQYTKSMVGHGNFFEEMGFYYVGPLDGHNLNHLVPILKNIRDDRSINHPILIHVVTEKGRGFDMPEVKDQTLHAVPKFDLESKKLIKEPSRAPSYTKVFSDALIQVAKEDEKIVAITAAMPSGTGLDAFARAYPERMFDVGIAEQHAVTFAAGLAAEGYKPFCTIYSTFLQRGYDQVVHDVAVQSLPVRFAIDRAGLVGADGPTHAGSFDITYLACLPGFVVMAPSDEAELARMVATAAAIDTGPSAFRYPRGEGRGVIVPATLDPLEIGKGRVLTEGKDIALLSFGTRLEEAEKAVALLKEHGVTATLADARFAKPLDTELVRQLVSHHAVVMTLEEGSIGGFAAQVQNYVLEHDLLTKKQKFRSLFLPDYFMEHNTPEAMYAEAGLDAESIAHAALKALGKPAPLRMVK